MANLFKKMVVLNLQQVRYLPRWSARRPAGIIMPEEYDDKTDSVIKNKKFLKHEKFDDNQQYPKIKWKQPQKNQIPQEFSVSSEKYEKREKFVKPLTITHKVKQNTPKPKAMDLLEATLDAEGNIIYTKMQNNDIRVNKIMADLNSKSTRNSNDLMLLEGKVLIKEALEANCKLEYILFSRMKEVDYLKPYLPKLGVKLYKMPYNELQNWSGLVTNPGIMGIFRIPETEYFETPEALPLTIICDNVREPSNLGAILRTSSGVGCENIVLTKGCVNVWDSKVLRSACGAHFKLHLSRRTTWDDIRSLIPLNTSVFVADNNKVMSKCSTGDLLVDLVAKIPVLPYFSVNFKLSKHIVLIIGGETEGLSEESYKLASEFNGLRLNIPLSNGVDSLNTGTALGIIAFEIKRQITSLKIENLEDYKVRNMSLNS